MMATSNWIRGGTFGGLALAVCLLPHAACGAELPLANPSCVYVGRIVSFDHIGADAGAVTIRAWNSAGELVAKTETFVSSDSAYNYRLSIPVASRRARGYATIGETLSFEVRDSVEGETFTSLVPVEQAVVGEPGELRRCDMMLSTDDDGDGVSDQFVRGIQSQMRRAGFTAWDPHADFDGDGQDNLAEYIAGTSMFSRQDVFAVKSAVTRSADGEELFELRFFSNPGRTYSVGKTTSLGKDASWRRSSFRRAPDGDEVDYVANASAESGERTLYVRRDASERSAFYRVEGQ